MGRGHVMRIQYSGHCVRDKKIFGPWHEATETVPQFYSLQVAWHFSHLFSEINMYLKQKLVL